VAQHLKDRAAAGIGMIVAVDASQNLTGFDARWKSIKPLLVSVQHLGHRILAS
jgi:hypothetical protein